MCIHRVKRLPVPSLNSDPIGTFEPLARAPNSGLVRPYSSTEFGRLRPIRVYDGGGLVKASYCIESQLTREELPTSCRQVAPGAKSRPAFEQYHLTFDESWPMLANIDHNWTFFANLGRCLPNVSPTRPTSANLVDVCRNGAQIRQTRQVLVEFTQLLINTPSNLVDDRWPPTESDDRRTTADGRRTTTDADGRRRTTADDGRRRTMDDGQRTTTAKATTTTTTDDGR